ncbi:HUS1 [Branchiostoma lanceolatum]|uniref:HUS1 protein n=1 Tax=Branchiostoma lanceolatum TaxID=7740 RepID=A0A8J9YTS6_BRALA|nr:HUS1 [Branchiostoma lanceolatum]
MATAREHVDPLDAAFDDIFLAEEKFQNQGYQEGFELGKQAGIEEGHVMGISQGRSMGSEIGFYHGFACSWKVILERDSSKGPRALKAVDALLELIWRIPIRNAEYGGLTEDLDRIRAKFRQVCSLLGVSPDFGVVSTISKLCKTCTFGLTPGKIYFILSEQVANGGVSMWCELPQANFFDQFQMEGVSAEDNEIYLELVPDNMSRALKSAQAAKLVKIKLTKKHAACLTFDIELPSLTNQSRTVVHDVPVNVIARRLWGEYQEPAMPQFDVSVYLPALKTIKTVVEKMKNLSNFLVRFPKVVVVAANVATY